VEHARCNGGEGQATGDVSLGKVEEGVASGLPARLTAFIVAGTPRRISAFSNHRGSVTQWLSLEIRAK
jgi:hypothetical protein